MTSLVTGADGFAGSHLVELLLAQGFNVVALVRSTPLRNLKLHPRLKIARGDVLDYNSLVSNFDVDYVYHLAAISGVEECRAMPEQAWKVNTQGTLNVIKACENMKVKRLLFTSTCHTVGYDIYAASKRACEDIISTFPNLDIVTARAYNHYGPRQRPEWLIPTIIRQVLTSDKLMLGAKNTTRDFTYVTDIVNGYFAAMMNGQFHRTYDLCSGIERTIESVANEVIRLTDWKGETLWATPRSNDFSRSVGNPIPAQELLNWVEITPFEEGLKRTIAFYKAILK